MEILAKRLPLAAILAASFVPRALADAGSVRVIPNGLVDLRPAQNAPWRPVPGEEIVSPGEEVRTHKNSSAQLIFSDGSRVQVNSFSIFAIDRMDSKEASFSLKIGKIRAAFAGLMSSHIVVKTPAAVAAVRGTVFEISVDKTATDVTMAEGVLEVSDNHGAHSVVTSEETMRIGQNGMERPRMLRLHDERSLPAVRSYAVRQEMAREGRRTMLEDMRNRELKSNEAQLGKDSIDAFGRRVRLEEYVLRPDANSFELLFMNQRSGSFNWGHYVETFAAPIPNDLSQVPAIAASGIMAVNQPTNWLKSIEFYATNTVDAEKELFTYGDPTQINFAGFGKGLLWYPSTLVETQTLYGPGVPNGQRVQFEQTTDYNISNPGLFTWTQFVQATPGADNLQLMFAAVLNPASTLASDPQSPIAGGSVVFLNAPVYNAVTTAASLPGGPNAANQLITTTYPDQSTLTVQKFLLDNQGNVLSLNPSSGVFGQNGDYNEEIKIDSNLFQGRSIDVLLAPSIIQQTGQAATTPNNL